MAEFFAEPTKKFITFTMNFSADFTECSVIDERGRELLAVTIRGDCPVERVERISKLVCELLAECQGMAAVVAPFRRDGEPS